LGTHHGKKLHIAKVEMESVSGLELRDHKSNSYEEVFSLLEAQLCSTKADGKYKLKCFVTLLSHIQ